MDGLVTKQRRYLFSSIPYSKHPVNKLQYGQSHAENHVQGSLKPKIKGIISTIVLVACDVKTWALSKSLWQCGELSIAIVVKYP